MTEDQERVEGLLRELRHRWKAFDGAANDTQLLTDIQRRIRMVESELIALGVGQAEIAAFNVAEDARERWARKCAFERAYEKSGGLLASE